MPAQRSPAGYRLYDEDAVERLPFIAAGKHLGLQLEEIRELLAVWEDGLCADVRARLPTMLQGSIAEAEQRMAELTAFTNRLVQAALAEIDGSPPPGRCDPGCGFLEHRPDPAGAADPAPPRTSIARPGGEGVQPQRRRPAGTDRAVAPPADRCAAGAGRPRAADPAARRAGRKRRRARRRRAALLRLLRLLDAPCSRALIFTGAIRNSLVVLPLTLALPDAYAFIAVVVVTQTLVELVDMVIFVRAVPRLVP